MIEADEAHASDCAAWAREAREKRKTAYAAGDMDAFDLWEKIARNWASQAQELKRRAAAQRAWLGDTPPVGIKSSRVRAEGSRPPREL